MLSHSQVTFKTWIDFLVNHNNTLVIQDTMTTLHRQSSNNIISIRIYSQVFVTYYKLQMPGAASDIEQQGEQDEQPRGATAASSNQQRQQYQRH